MNTPTKKPVTRAVITLIFAMLAGLSVSAAGGGGDPIGNFGPTGLEIDVKHPALTIKVLAVQKGSPADGKITQGQVITTINGKKLTTGTDPRVQLSDLISQAEAGNGKLTCKVDGKDVTLTIPTLGSFSKTWPINCQKTNKIVRAQADTIAKQADKLTSHNLYNGLAILMLISTGEDKDLDVVRGIYKRKMKGFKGADTGSHTWHNAYSGIAACEYYLRTGDKSVMPYINAICESARKYQVHGGWTHWATSVNTQYTGGGLMNPAGTPMLITLLLAKQCGAKVDEGTLQRGLKYFYRFAGHGSNPYGDHRPEDGYGSNNGKSEMLAVAMHIASHADKGGEIYALARDKNAQTPLYSYPHMLRGHTGGGLGATWHGIAAAYMIEKKPALYRNRMDECQWFYQLSRRHDGSFGISGGARYDQIKYGYAMGLSLTAPRKALQITGASRSKFAQPFTLPALPWGRKADRIFFSLDGGPKYVKSKEKPPVEFDQISKANESELESFAHHPEHGYREQAADTIRKNGHFRLIEKLLESDDPFAFHTACLALNRFQPWKVSSGKGWLSAKSINPDEFTPKMFNALIKTIKDPAAPVWIVDGAMIALAVAQPEQIKSELGALLPWLKHDDWWLNEAASMALSPALRDPEALKIILPKMVPMLANNDHIKGRGYIEWMLTRTAAVVPDDMRKQISDTLMTVYQTTPSQKSVEGDMGRIGISSNILSGTLNWVLTANPELAPEMAKLSVDRLGDMRERELGKQIDTLINAGSKIDAKSRKDLGTILIKHYRPTVVGDDVANLKKMIKAGNGNGIRQMNKILQIDQMAGTHPGWLLLDNNSKGEQVRYMHSFDPPESLEKSNPNRYRKVTFPKGLENWYQPDFNPAKNGWKQYTDTIGQFRPDGYPRPENWTKQDMKQAGEILLTQKTFELKDLDYAMFRISAFTRQGYRIYLNGNLIVESKGRSKTWQARTSYFNNNMKKHLKKGTNVISAVSLMQYFRGKEGDIYLSMEGLKELPKLD